MKERKRSAARRTPMTVLTDMLLLFWALAAVLLSVVTVYQIEVHESALLRCALAAAVVIAGMLSLPRFKLPLTLALLGAWGWGLWKLWEPLVLGGERIWCDVVNTVGRKIPGVGQWEPADILTSDMWRDMASLWLLMVGIAFALLLGLCLCRLRRAGPVILLTLLPILPALCVTEAPAPVPVLALLALWSALLLNSQVGPRDPAGVARLRPVAVLISVLVLALLAQSLPTEGAAQPDWALRLREDALDTVGRLDLSAFAGRWGWTGSGSTRYVTLTGSGSSATGRTALQVTSSCGGKYYLRGWSSPVYTGERWEPFDRGTQGELKKLLAAEGQTQPQLLLAEAMESSMDRVWLDPGYFSAVMSAEKGELKRETMTVENISAPAGCVYYPYALAEAPEGARLEDDAHLSRVGRGRSHEITFYPEAGDPVYISMLANIARPEGEDPYRAFVYDHYLQVPRQLRLTLLEWMDGTDADEGFGLMGIRSPEDYVEIMRWFTEDKSADETVTEEEVENVRHFYNRIMSQVVREVISNAAVYDKNTPAPPEGEDYVSWFLTESGRGYCMHFASAATLLLRTLGVPARYVGGYVVDVPSSGKAQVPDTAAHAWTEVWLEGIGWYPLEVTPGFEGEATGENEPEDFAPTATPSPTPTAAPTSTRAPAEDEEEPSPTPSAPPAAVPSQGPEEPVGGGEGEAGGKLPDLVWKALSIPAAGALLWLLRREMLRRRKKRLEGKTNAAVLWAYLCYERLKRWGAEECEELTALAEKARFSQHILTEEERSRAVELLTGERRRLEETLPGWRGALLRLWWGSP